MKNPVFALTTDLGMFLDSWCVVDQNNLVVVVLGGCEDCVPKHLSSNQSINQTNEARGGVRCEAGVLAVYQGGVSSEARGC